jgi:hypothetical protein
MEIGACRMEIYDFLSERGLSGTPPKSTSMENFLIHNIFRKNGPKETISKPGDAS